MRSVDSDSSQPASRPTSRPTQPTSEAQRLVSSNKVRVCVRHRVTTTWSKSFGLSKYRCRHAAFTHARTHTHRTTPHTTHTPHRCTHCKRLPTTTFCLVNVSVALFGISVQCMARVYVTLPLVLYVLRIYLFLYSNVLIKLYASVI